MSTGEQSRAGVEMCENERRGGKRERGVRGDAIGDGGGAEGAKGSRGDGGRRGRGVGATGGSGGEEGERQGRGESLAVIYNITPFSTFISSTEPSSHTHSHTHTHVHTHARTHCHPHLPSPAWVCLSVSISSPSSETACWHL